VKVAVVRFPGSNCDDDTRHALEMVAGIEVDLVWHGQESVGKVDAIILPGGFSYGDYLRSGALASHSPVMAAVEHFARRGGPVLGICNGFQVLTERGLLPGQLARNRSLHFVCRTVTVRVDRNDLPFTSRYRERQLLRLPIAHNEGRYFLPPSALEEVEGNGQVALRYASADGARDDASNPNGSVANIAGVTNRVGNVLGLMPHPERAVEPLLGSGDGAALFESLFSVGSPAIV
jgi:phosphoribosylformylglycinamidine synthase I